MAASMRYGRLMDINPGVSDCPYSETMEEQLKRDIGGVGEHSTTAKLLRRLSDNDTPANAGPFSRFGGQLAMLLLPAVGLVVGFGLVAAGRPYLSEWV